MREILFRGNGISRGEWIEGYLFKTIEHTYIAYAEQYDDDLFYSPENIFIEVDPETVGRYTGLTDKYGKKIFEGDIVKTNKFNEPNKKYIIKYDLQFGAFIGEDKYHMYFTTFDGDSDQFEVIGNIHDNPELLSN